MLLNFAAGVANQMGVGGKDNIIRQVYDDFKVEF